MKSRRNILRATLSGRLEAQAIAMLRDFSAPEKQVLKVIAEIAPNVNGTKFVDAILGVEDRVMVSDLIEIFINLLIEAYK